MNKVLSILSVGVLIGRMTVLADGLAFCTPSNSISSVVVENNRIDFLAGRQAATNEIDVANWPRDKVFIKVGDDVFPWGPVWDYIDIYLNAKPISVPPGTTFEEIKIIKGKLALVVARKTAKLYIGGALLAQKAKEMGLSEADSKFVRTNLVQQYWHAFPKKYQKTVYDNLFCPGGYYTHCIDTMLLGDAYREVVLKPLVKVSDEEIQASIHTQELKNAAVASANAKMGKVLSAIRDDILAGRISFADAARQYSDCDSGGMGGYWGRFDPDDNNLLPEIKSVVFTLPTNAISQVVETPVSYHIFKVLAPSEPLPAGVDDDDEDEDEEDEEEVADGESTDNLAGRSIRLCHIMLEKRKLKPVSTQEEMRVRLYEKKMNRLVIETQKNLAQTIPIECALEDVTASFLRKENPENAKKSDLKTLKTERKDTK